MPSAELAFEVFGAALEATRGTAVTPPTHVLPLVGLLKPVREKWRPDEQRGTLEEFYRSKTIRTRAEFDLSGPADPNYAPFIFNLVAKANSTPTTPTNGVLTRLWTFTPTITSDDLKSATLFSGDPNVQVFQSVYGMADEMTLDADASGTDGATMGLTGMAYFPTRPAAPALPASIAGDLLAPGAMQLWMDSTSAIGTTEVTGRFIKTNWTIPTGVTRKHYANGPTAGLNFTKAGRTKRSAKASITVELSDLSMASGKEYLLFEADTVVKMRIRINGGLIESVTPDYYSYIQLDIYGALEFDDWADVEGSNRTMTFTVTSEYNSTAGASFVLSAQNARTSL